jgi:DNA-binding NtrC family response regulator
MGRRSFTVSPDALELIRGYHWPGKVRELENVLVRAITLCPDDCIEPEHLGITPICCVIWHEAVTVGTQINGCNM